ncbi:MAG: FHA domain-containing protein [Anaerolineales bacterium]|nr:FHA domain-containing protein [Anaerolineales bacterium]
MINLQTKKKFLRVILILISLLLTTIPAGAQAGRFVDILPPETGKFPLMSVYFNITERDGRLITDLIEDQVTLRENGVEQEILDFKSLTPGIQVVTAINISAPFAIQDINGNSRFDFIANALIEWAKQTPVSSPDDLSLLTNDGLDLTHLENREDLVIALEEYSPSLRDTESDFNVLARAIEAAADPVDQLGMKRVVLFFTPPATPEGSAAIESLISRAKESQVIVYTILVSSPAFFTSSGAQILADLSIETNGEFSTYSGDEPLPDFANLFTPLRSTYLINYQSQIVTSGDQTLEVTIASDLGLSDGQRIFPLEVQPPNPIFISPPREIFRSIVPTGAEDISSADFVPEVFTLDMIIDFPDQHPRDLEEIIFRVDGEVKSILTSPPYDQIEWDLRDYQTSAVHYLTIEAVDILGLSRQSIQTPVEVIIDIPPPSINTIFLENSAAFFGLALVLILGIILFIFISRGTIKPVLDFGGNRFFTKKGNRPNLPSLLRKGDQNEKSIGSIDDSDQPESKKQNTFRLVPISDILQQQIPKPIQGWDEELILGNDPDPGINIPHPSVDKNHARINIRPDGSHEITDEGSSAGTWINYKQISPSKPQALKDGDIIHIGEAGFRYQVMNNASEKQITEEITT